MCGICGYIHLDRAKRVSQYILKNMMDTLANRGPDDEGAYLKDNVALGHRRLSIIDLESGHQPMANEDGSIIIVYNGEVYNFLSLKAELTRIGHKFRTHSDTEVIIHAYEEYGDDCVNRFNGMFAFAIWDSRAKRLFLARDKFGKKPLYYAVFDNQFIFGSELKAVLKHPSSIREIDLIAVSKYLSYEYVPTPFSIFKGIKKLEAGSSLSVSLEGEIKTGRYWDLSIGQKNFFKNPKDIEARMLELLKESVRKRLVADVPLGVFLSGGIDSSSVVSMMAGLMDPKEIKTFSIGFKEKAFDESADAKKVADYFGTDHHEKILNPRAMLDVLEKILTLLDEPFADSSIIPTYLVSNFTRQYVKVALGGDGGDELFLGYPSFRAQKLDIYFEMFPAPVRKASLYFMSKVTRGSSKDRGLGSMMRRFSRGLNFPKDVRHQVWIGTFTPEDQRKLFLSNKELDFSPDAVYSSTQEYFQNSSSISPLDRAMYIHMKTYMTDDILTKVDRASMANSLEVRAPFLDADFVEFVASVPSNLKLRNFDSKWILKHALRDKLPRETLRKGKQGFAVPVGEWLKADLRGLLLSAFDKSKIEREGIFNYGHVRNLIDGFLESKGPTTKEIWALFMFEMWYDRWMARR
ncbi:MAG: asparagine synthase (glutamine-hydrolyzing) [Omnitrophica bacterium RIFCSPLOWO2_01_FULL_45_10]|nr:MAG: asparagine synthase (glutamine-hydrolyzing) [Omnitrophica bacterium RIFCSPLOWO2_01_FULL_45_10]